MRNWYFEDWLLNGLTVLLSGFILFFIYDIAHGNTYAHKGKIHEMTFVHGNQTTTVGVALTGKGAAPVIATSGHPDEWSMIVLSNDTYLKIECSADDYYHHEIGDNVDFTQRIGRVTGIVYDTSLK